MYRKKYADVATGPEEWRSLPVPEGELYAWNENSTYIHEPPYFKNMTTGISPIKDARVLVMVGDSVTTVLCGEGEREQAYAWVRAEIARAVVIVDLQLQPGMGGRKTGKDRAKIQRSEAHRRRDRQLAAQRCGAVHPPGGAFRGGAQLGQQRAQVGAQQVAPRAVAQVGRLGEHGRQTKGLKAKVAGAHPAHEAGAELALLRLMPVLRAQGIELELAVPAMGGVADAQFARTRRQVPAEHGRRNDAAREQRGQPRACPPIPELGKHERHVFVAQRTEEDHQRRDQIRDQQHAQRQH